MKYKEILDDVLDGKFVSPTFGGTWIKMRDDGLWEAENGTILDVPKRYYSSDTWVVLVKPKEPNPSETIEFNDGLDDEELCHKKPTLLQAIEQKKIIPGDTVILSKPTERLTYNDDGYFHDENDEPQDWSAEHWMCRDYEIVKTNRLKVYSHREAFKILYLDLKEDDLKDHDTEITFERGFYAGDKNGQAKERNNLQTFIDAVEEWMQDIYKNTVSKVDNLAHAKKIEYERKNIKPIDEIWPSPKPKGDKQL